VPVFSVGGAGICHNVVIQDEAVFASSWLDRTLRDRRPCPLPSAAAKFLERP